MQIGGGEERPERMAWAGRLGDTELGGVRGMPGACLTAAVSALMGFELYGFLAVTGAEADGEAKAMAMPEAVVGAISRCSSIRLPYGMSQTRCCCGDYNPTHV